MIDGDDDDDDGDDDDGDDDDDDGDFVDDDDVDGDNYGVNRASNDVDEGKKKDGEGTSTTTIKRV